jgi:hypothetical protein
MIKQPEQFKSKEEEISALYSRIEEIKKKEGAENHEEASLKAVREHISQPIEQAARPEYALKEKEEKEIQSQLFDLPPEAHDAKVLKLLYLAEEKGILNALNVARKLNNPHLLDDFERALARAIAQKFKEHSN